MRSVPADEILTAAEAAALLNVTDRTVRNWADDKKLACITLPSGQRRFRRSDIDAILTSTEASS